MTQLLFCPIGKSQLTLPDSMTSIASSAFSNCPYVYNLEIPGSVTTIEVDAFTGSGIKAVTIPPSVTSIGSQSSWTPDVIRGYTGSQAERFADENGYIFESIGNLGEDPEPDPEPKPDPEPEPEPEPKPDNNDSNNNNNNNNNTGGNSGGTTQTGTGGGTNAGTRTSVSRNMGTAQVGSGTPKTGIAFDARYVLCLGVFFAGGYLVISKKKKKVDVE